MRNLLGMGEKREEGKEYPKHDVSQKFVTLVSPYIGDMHILINKYASRRRKERIGETQYRNYNFKTYIDRGMHAEHFIQLLCHESSSIWTEFMYDEQLSTEKKNQYFKLMISACDVYDIENNNKLSKNNRETFKEELIKTNEILKEITGEEVQYVRPPYGSPSMNCWRKGTPS